MVLGESMRFEEFARSHGLIINGVETGKWVATPTEDHPRSRNGRYKYMGDHGWVQNWATMTSPVIWKGQSASLTPSQIRQAKFEADKERREAASKAASKAGWILHQTRQAFHPYLKAKGFPDEQGHVWVTDDGLLLVIPMRVDGRLVGCQLIDDKGEKKFLSGQITKGAVFTMDAKGVPVFVEGYATALSVRAAMKAMKIRYTIHVCFSASNLEFVAGKTIGGLIIADNDSNGVGEKAAQKTGKPYWMPPTVGHDANDYHATAGLFQVSQSLKRSLISNGLITAAQSSPPSASPARV